MNTKKNSPANSLTQAVLHLLHLRGFVAWRQNNGAIYDASFGGYRSGSVTPGISDVVGYHRLTGRFCAVEVKSGSDKLRPEQARFLAEVHAAGGFACEVRNISQLGGALAIYLAALAA